MSTDCKSCKGKLQIKRSYPKVIGDNSLDTPTQLFECLEFACLNKKCEMANIVIDVQEHERELLQGN